MMVKRWVVAATMLASPMVLAKPPTPAQVKEEVEQQLKRIHQGATTYFMGKEVADAKGNVTEGYFPKSIPMTPKASCCSQPDQLCQEPDWKAAPWSELTILRPLDGSHFRYEYTSSGKGKAAKFTVRAVGDPTCSGKEEVWEIAGTVDKEGNPVDTATPRKVK